MKSNESFEKIYFEFNFAKKLLVKMPDSPQPVPRHSTSPKTPASSPPLTADVKPSPSSKAASPTASPSLPNSWHNAQVNLKQNKNKE